MKPRRPTQDQRSALTIGVRADCNIRFLMPPSAKADSNLRALERILVMTRWISKSRSPGYSKAEIENHSLMRADWRLPPALVLVQAVAPHSAHRRECGRQPQAHPEYQVQSAFLNVPIRTSSQGRPSNGRLKINPKLSSLATIVRSEDGAGEK